MKSKTLIGDPAVKLIESQLAQHADGIMEVLARFEPDATVRSWFETIRAIEELINLPGEIDDDVLAFALFDLNLAPRKFDPRRLKFVCHYLGYYYGAAFAQRQTVLLLQLSGMQNSFAIAGHIPAAIGLSTVAHAIGYLQSRRRHLMSLLYIIPQACKGTVRMTDIDTLNWMLPQAEISGTTITGLLQQRAMSELHDDFKLYVQPHGFSSSHRYHTLDDMFLETERVSIIDVAFDAAPVEYELLPSDRIFSAAELRNQIALMGAAFAEFKLEDTAFVGLANLARDLSWQMEDDFWVTISPEELNVLADKHEVSVPHRRLLTTSSQTFVAALNCYAAFVPIEGILLSSATSLSRFLYNFKNVCLYSKRRFQIRSGFIFEERVKDELTKQGFVVHPIKRLDRKEFDVVATRDGVVFNIQCKNNLMDPSWIDLDPVRFIRTNRTLERYYERAIIKERSREELLKNRLGIERVEPFVITRFPIVTKNSRISSLSHIREFSTKADTILNTKPIT
ncbi:hypothetical protein [Brucella pituitosa]|uniref:hypothetical protein n=1 Tax=Brucella pituitosa TaxID=571256 RepID=UPI000F5D7C99|nr:hypothetical protein ECB98_21995 [Brucellaceae bacterium VT-16-1752]